MRNAEFGLRNGGDEPLDAGSAIPPFAFRTPHLSHSWRSRRATTPIAVGAQNANIHLTLAACARSISTRSSASRCSSFASSADQRPSHLASSWASRCSSVASKRAKFSSLNSRRSARYVASTALNQLTSSLVTSSPPRRGYARRRRRVNRKAGMRNAECGMKVASLSTLAQPFRNPHFEFRICITRR